MPEVARVDIQAGWTTVSLGDVVEVINDYWDRDTTVPERLVAGEHIDEGDMHIRRWAMTDDDLIPPTFNRRFQENDALLHSRNIDKVAQPGFGGITGEKIFIIRSKDQEVLLQELIPYLVATDHFRQYAESRWAGSTNKFLNKTPLMQYEFALPPLEEQRRIAEVLQAARIQSDRMQKLCTAARVLYASTAVHLFSRDSGQGIKPSDWRPSGWDCEALEEIVVTDAPVCYGIVQVGDFDSEGVPTIAINNLDGDFQEGVHRTTPEIERNYGRSRVISNDILISIKATIGEIAIVPPSFEGNISRDIARVRIKNAKVRQRFFYHLYKSPRFRRYLQSLVVGSTRAELSIAQLRTMEVPFPSLEVQDQLVAELDAIETSLSTLSGRYENARALTRFATNQLLERGVSE